MRAKHNNRRAALPTHPVHNPPEVCKAAAFHHFGIVHDLEALKRQHGCGPIVHVIWRGKGYVHVRGGGRSGFG